MADRRPAQTYLASIYDRVSKALGLVGGQGTVDFTHELVPTINVFDADTVGFHGYSGRCFAGNSSVVGAVAGISKILPRAHAELVINKHIIANQAGAAGTFSIRFLPAGLVDAFVYNENRTFWIEQTPASASAAEFIGLVNAVSNDAIAPGSQLIQLQIPPLSSVQIDLPIHLFAGARLCYSDETTNQAMSASWSGYVI